MSNKRELICQKHDYIIKELENTRESIKTLLKSDNIEDIKYELYYIESNLYCVIDEVDEAKECGQKMEDRLCKYKDAIENLGFIRNKI